MTRRTYESRRTRAIKAAQKPSRALCPPPPARIFNLVYNPDQGTRSWPPELAAVVEQLWMMHSATQIVKILKAEHGAITTRSAVVAKANRLGFKKLTVARTARNSGEYDSYDSGARETARETNTQEISVHDRRKQRY